MPWTEPGQPQSLAFINRLWASPQTFTFTDRPWASPRPSFLSTGLGPAWSPTRLSLLLARPLTSISWAWSPPCVRPAPFSGHIHRKESLSEQNKHWHMSCSQRGFASHAVIPSLGVFTRVIVIRFQRFYVARSQTWTEIKPAGFQLLQGNISNRPRHMHRIALRF